MEGSYWLRFASVVLLTLACVYLLLPTVLQDAQIDASGGFARVEREGALEAWFTVPDGDPDDATAEAFAARLDAGGVGIERVVVKDGRVVAFLKPGTRKEDVASFATVGEARYFGPEAAGIDPAALADVEDPAALIGMVVSTTRIPASATPLSLEPSEVQAGDGSLRLGLGSELPAGADPVLVAVQDRIIGWFRAAPAGTVVDVTLAQDTTPADLAAVAGGSQGEVLTRYVAPEAATEAEAEEDAEVQTEASVSWWESLLPDTRLALGLDLQGGIDLTLQVDLDAAAVAAVQRDRRQLLDQAAEDDLDVEIVRDRTRYGLRFFFAGDFGTLKTWIDDNLRGDYVYVESAQDGERTYHLWEMIEQRVTDLQEQAVEQNLETLRKRVDATGVREPSIVKMGGGRINIQLPGVADPQSAIDAIGTQATLDFRLVDYEADQNQVARYVAEAERALPKEQFEDLETLTGWLRGKGYLPLDRTIRFEYEESPGGELIPVGPLQLLDDVPLTGGDVENAGVGFDQQNFPRVLLDFKPRGANVFCDLTTKYTQKRFAIVLDDQIRSAPNIREPICGGSASIEMGTSANAIDDANTLALVLRTGALTAPVDIGEVRAIGASLGADAIATGQEGAIAGLLITVIFMWVWYGWPGVFADVALLLNVMLVFALLALFGATLTLPGIAGVALTIGMAVDANIIIYERIREELKLGVNARKAVDTGYDKGVVAVLDANITTAIAGVVLYSYGTGPIKGFAVTLLIGIFTTLVTALFVTRTFMDMYTRRSDARLRL